MSLDVYLYDEQEGEGETPFRTGSGIFVREGGQTREITRAEWSEKFPDREPVIAQHDDEYQEPVYEANITHNLNRMADEAGLYEALWRPDEHDLTAAKQLIEPLERGLQALRADPEKFKSFNPPNGWGNYEGLVSFVERYLEACRNYPDAKVSVSR